MISDLPPEPLVAADVDLRGMPWMPLDTQRLLDSDLFALATAEEFRAAVVLWCKAWQQVPAGSLPSDDRVLAHLSGTGARWQKVKAMALRGFVLCSDGRLYHSVIVEKVEDAWKERLRNREKQRKWREKAALRNGNADGDVTVTQPGTKPLCHAGEGEGQLQGQGEGLKNIEPLRAMSGKPDADPPEVEPKGERKRRLNADAVAVLDFLNRATGSRFQPVEANLSMIRARLAEADIGTCKRVIANRWDAWADDPKMAEYLRPATLFAARNFANYAGQLPALNDESDAVQAPIFEDETL